MKKMIKLMYVLVLIPCFAQAADRWEIQAGFNRIDPQVRSDDLTAPSLPNTKINVDAGDSAIFTIRYALNDEIGMVFFGGLPYTHDIKGAGAIAGVGKIGETKQVSPTLIIQRRFYIPELRLRPYIGTGLTYTYFYDERGSNVLTSLTNPGGDPTTMKIKAAFGLTFQAGIEYDITDHWFVNAGALKTFISTKSKLSTGQEIKTDLNPISTNFTVGYRF